MSVTPPGRAPKVLLVHSSAELYGSDRALINICKALKGHAATTVLLPEDGPLRAALEAAGAAVTVMDFAVIRRGYLRPVRLPGFLLELIASYIRLYRFVKDGRFDVVHMNTTVVFWVCYLRFMYPRGRYVTHVRELIGRPGGAAGRLVYRQAARFSDAVIAVSGEVMDAVKGAAPRYSGKVSLLTDGLAYRPDAKPVKSRREVRCSLGIPEDAPVAVCVGRINLWKGQEVLLKAFGLLLPEFPHARLLLVGDTFRGYEYLLDGLKKKADELGISGSVHFAGFRDDVADILGASDVFVLPSIRPEPFGLVVLEAMAAGLPVVATDGGGPRETVVDGVTGRLVPFSDAAALADALAPLLRDPAARAEMGGKGRALFDERFASGLSADKLMRAYGV